MSLGFIDIRWYSLAYIFAFILGSVIIKRLNSGSYRLISDDKIDKFFIWAIIGVILGGRIGYVLFYQTNLFFTKPTYILEIWNGGMSFHGGLIGMILSIYLFSLKYKIQFFHGVSKPLFGGFQPVLSDMENPILTSKSCKNST